MAEMDGPRLVRMLETRLGPEAVAKMLDLTLDSGATIHLIRDAKLLSNVRDLDFPIAVEVADGRQVLATKIGDIQTEYIKLAGVHVVPELKMNLVSVRELADEDILIVFGKNSAELWKGGERVGGAIAEGRLWKLRFLRPTGDATPHTSPAAPGEHNTSYVANAASSSIKNSVTMFKESAFQDDSVTSFEKPAVYGHWMASSEDPAVPFGLFNTIMETCQTCGDWFPLTVEMDGSDETGGAACWNNMIGDGSFAPGKAHMGSDGMHGTDFMKVMNTA